MKKAATTALKQQIASRLDGVRDMARVDGWENRTSGLGTFMRDKVMATRYVTHAPLMPMELDALYMDDMAARIVDKLPEDCIRQGFKVQIGAAPDEEVDVNDQREFEEGIFDKLDELKAIPKLIEAWCWGRLYGGGAVYVMTDDPAKPEEPLDETKIKSIHGLYTIDRRDLMPFTWDSDHTSPTFGEPIVYMVTVVAPPGIGSVATPYAPLVLIHASRLIVFEGARTPLRRKLENGGWALSVLQRPHEVLRQFNVAWQSVTHLMSDSAQAVYKMNGLIKMLASGGKADVLQRMELVDLERSNARALVIDKDGEEFERKDTNFTGAEKILEKFLVRLAAAADMPVTVLTGQSPAGLNATGESDRGLWDDRVKAGQVVILKPRLERLITLVMAAKDGPTKGVAQDSWCIEFNALRQMTELEIATLRNTVATMDKTYIDAGVVTPEEVAQSRFPAMGWNMDMKINLDLRASVQELDDKRALEDAKNPPKPPADPNAVLSKGGKVPATAKDGKVPPGE